MLKYTEEHEWLNVDGDIATMGITEHATTLLGDIVFVELPAVGTTINKDETYGVIESVKAVSDLFSPVTGEVVAINGELGEAPARINEDCYGDGWLIQIVPSDEDERETLLEPAAYAHYLEERDA